MLMSPYTIPVYSFTIVPNYYSVLEILCEMMNQDNFIWNSPRESRVYCVYENIHCLQNVFSSLLNFKNFRFDPNTTYHKSYGRVINPKSLTIHQLYGLFDPKTHEWTDGVLGSTFREYANNTAEERKWIVMDGPVDPGLIY